MHAKPLKFRDTQHSSSIDSAPRPFPHTRSQRVRVFLSHFNPKTVFWDRPKEDIAAFRAAKSIRDCDIATEPEVIKAKVDAKLAGALAISEVAGTCFGAPALGILFQELTKNAYFGVAGTVIGDYLPAVLSFEVAWLALNISYYKHSAESFWGRIKQFYTDAIPVHKAAVIAAVPAYAVGATLSSLIIAGINHFFPHGAEKIHIMPLISEIINFGVVETIFLTLVGVQVLQIGKKIAARYTDYLKQRYETTA